MSCFHPANVTLAIKKLPGTMENNHVYFQHRMHLLINQFQSGKKDNMFSKKKESDPQWAGV